MAIIPECEVWYCKLNPKRPNAKFNKQNPTWEIQIRTTSKAVKAQWEEMNLYPKPVIPEDGEPYYRVNLKKNKFNSNGQEGKPVTVVNGQLDNIDPDSIGNGSIANIRIWQYEYPASDGSGVRTKSIPMAIQVIKHILYKPKKEEVFDETETEVIKPPDYEEDEPDAMKDDAAVMEDEVPF